MGSLDEYYKRFTRNEQLCILSFTIMGEEYNKLKVLLTQRVTEECPKSGEDVIKSKSLLNKFRKKQMNN